MQTLSRKNKGGGSYDVKESKYASSHKTLRDEESVSDSEDEDDSEVMDDDEGGQEAAPSDQGRNSIDILNLGRKSGPSSGPHSVLGQCKFRHVSKLQT